eukprot:8698500-Pyramimonas_sp.AAC.1
MQSHLILPSTLGELIDASQPTVGLTGVCREGDQLRERTYRILGAVTIRFSVLRDCGKLGSRVVL